MTQPQPLVSVVMGSRSDFETLKGVFEHLSHLQIPFETRVLSAHRTPHLLEQYAQGCETREIRCIIAGAGGAAHLPGMLAAFTRLPVLGIPVQSRALSGLDSLLSMVQMPAGVPVATFAIGEAGAKNAALFAAAMLANEFPEIKVKLEQFRKVQTDTVLENPFFEGYVGIEL